MSAIELIRVAQVWGLAATAGPPVWLALVWRPAAAASGSDDAALRRRIRALTAAGAFLLLASGLADLLRLGAALSGGAPWSAQSLRLTVELATSSSLGWGMVARSALGLVVWAATYLNGASPWLAPLLAGPLLASFSFTGHNSPAAMGSIWPATMDFIHLIANTAWLGGLACLLLILPLLRDHTDVFQTALQRFSRLGLAAMAALGLTGLALARWRLYGPSALVEHPYGQALLVKLGFLAGVLVLAAASRRLLNRLGAKHPGHSGPRWLKPLLTGELLLGLATVTAAGILSVTAPPRGEPVRLTVTLQDGKIIPEQAELPANRPVLLTVINQGSVAHSYTVPAFPHEMISRGHAHGDAGDMAVIVEAHRTAKVQFIPRRPGTYEAYCMVEGHQYQGERAALTVR